ncbi:MAG: hypothetical protein SP4CHLAM5_11820 [Chlamydiia bacterium]|nr:hypothetical protein [Chlamydiia bacterium]MCH9624792.1 hypothetical protein [Chlamydiia bacterium]
MLFNKISWLLFTIPALAFCAEEADINIVIITPKIETLEIQSISGFFTANHQSYPLLPSVIRFNYIEYPIFTAQEALCILDNGKPLYKTVQRGSFIALPVTIKPTNVETNLTVSVSEEQEKRFIFLPRDKNSSKVAIKLFFIDISKGEVTHSFIEILPNKHYPIEEVQGKTLFIFIPKTEKEGQNTININNYSLPLEVHYHTP